MNTTQVVAAETVKSTGDELGHVYCCNEDLALCGTDLSGADESDFDPESDPGVCVVCHDLMFGICARCGS